MTDIINILNNLRNVVVMDLLNHDVTILAIRIEKNDESNAVHYVVHCKMDEWYMTWAREYYHQRDKFTNDYDRIYVPFVRGIVFALIGLEDV